MDRRGCSRSRRRGDSPDRAIWFARNFAADGSDLTADGSDLTADGSDLTADKTALETAPAPPQGTTASRSGTQVSQPAIPVQREWTIYFRPDDTSLTAEATKALSDIARVLSPTAIEALSITGHCALAGSEAGRVSISVGRAQAVADYLRENGVSLSDSAVVKGVGATDPATTDLDKQDLNRRTVIAVRYLNR